MGKIVLEGISIYAYHGCFKEETKVGTLFEIDLTIDTFLEKAAASDNLKDTINYQTVMDVLKKEMNKPSKLLEHIAQRCLNSLLDTFDTIDALSIKISKLNPPLGGKIKKVSVVLNSNK